MMDDDERALIQDLKHHVEDKKELCSYILALAKELAKEKEDYEQHQEEEFIHKVNHETILEVVLEDEDILEVIPTLGEELQVMEVDNLDLGLPPKFDEDPKEPICANLDTSSIFQLVCEKNNEEDEHKVEDDMERQYYSNEGIHEEDQGTREGKEEIAHRGWRGGKRKGRRKHGIWFVILWTNNDSFLFVVEDNLCLNDGLSISFWIRGRIFFKRGSMMFGRIGETVPTQSEQFQAVQKQFQDETNNSLPKKPIFN